MMKKKKKKKKSYLVEGVDGRRQSSVDTEYFIVDDRREAQVVEYIRAVSPYIHGSILPQTFVIKTIHLGDLARLVISSYEGNSIGEPDLTWIDR